MLTNAFVLANGILFNRSNDLMIKCLISVFNQGGLRSKVLWKENNRFQESYNVKYFKEVKRLKNLQKVETYLEPKRLSAMELICEYT